MARSPLEFDKTIADPKLSAIAALSDLELARALSERLALAERDWHRLKSNPSARAKEQIAAAIVFLLSDRPEEALPRLQQAIGWLEGSLEAPPCPDRHRRSRS